jgi:hypothetical protein
MSRPETSFGPRPWIQQHWDARAAGNFILGGAGAGLLAAAPLAGGTVLPVALLLFSTVAPEALWLAGLMAAATGWRLKFTLVTRAAHNQGFSLPHLPTR